MGFHRRRRSPGRPEPRDRSRTWQTCRLVPVRGDRTTHAVGRGCAGDAALNGGCSMAKRDDGGPKGRREAVVESVSDVSKAATKELRKLEKALAAARKTEAKRVRQ